MLTGISRIAIVFSIQTWLGESEDSQKSGGTPGYFSVGMSGMFLFLFSLLSQGRSIRSRESVLKKSFLLTKCWGGFLCSPGFGGDIFALVHSSSWSEDDAPAPGTVAIKGIWDTGNYEVGNGRNE